jgi:cytochrome c553
MLSVACAGPDTGTITFGTGESAVGETPKGGGTSTDKNNNDPAPGGASGEATFKGETYTAISQCGSCHNPGTNGAPIFFGTDAASTYPLLKAKGYHLANSTFMTKGAHTGPALSADQTAAMNKWIAAEAAGGGATQQPAGDGGT